MTIASSRLGNTSTMSISRMIDVSTIPPAKGGGEAEHDARRERQRDDREADQQREPRAVDQPREHVAAEIVGAERKGERAALLPGRRASGRRAELLDRRVRRDDIGEAARPAISSTMTPRPTTAPLFSAKERQNSRRRPGGGRIAAVSATARIERRGHQRRIRGLRKP